MLSAAAYAIVYNDKQEVLFVRRRNTGYMDGKLGLPSGHVEQYESFESAMKREAKEEVGIDVSVSKNVLTLHRYQPSGEHDYIDSFYQVSEYQGVPMNTEPDKCSEIVWARPEDVKDEIISYISTVFEKLATGITFFELERKDNE